MSIQPVQSTTITRTSRSTLLNLLSSLLRPTTTVKPDENALQQQLSTFLNSVSQAFFDPLANFFARPAPTASESEKRQAVQYEQDKIRDALQRELLKQTTNTSLQDDGSVLLEMYNAKLPNHPTFSSFLEALQVAFSQEKLTIYDLPEREKLRALLAREEMRTILATLARAVQDVAISRPQLYYDNEVVPVEVIDILNVVLQKVEDMRTAYTLSGVLELKEGLRKLYLEIARIKGDIQLPIRSLVTAPLSLEDLDLYVRKEEEALKLAHQFIRGDGVFLIAGYRGVGKSTYLNKALTMIEDAQACQHEEYPWLVIPIFVNLAKATGVDSVLRLCMRSLYGKLSQGKGKKGPYIDFLANEEREKIWFAYKRSVYKVNYQQEHDVTILKSGQMGINIGIKAGSFLPKTATAGLADALPSFSASAATSKEDSNKTINIVALPDYDEDKAEDDVVEIIRLLTRARTSTKGVKARIKLVFVFDEMDKMELENQTKVVNQLKNLFLERETVFVLVTSKKFYYEWWKGRKVEDDVLASYFSWIKMVPLFTSQETLELLKRLIPIKEADLQPEEKAFIETYARYLTYNAWGVPRDIVRELLTNQRWIEDGLQPYITNQVEQYFAILVYATIQQALEDEGILSGQLSTSAGASASSGTTPGANVTIAPEHIWFNEGQREQIKRGLYLLVEEFFNQTSIEVNAKSEFFQKLYTGNFELVSPNDYERLLDRLVMKLGSTQLNITGPLTRLYPSSTVLPLFSVDPPTSSLMFKKLQVSQDFYSLTGRSMVATSAEPIADTLDISEIQELLDKEGPDLRNRALTALQSQAKPFSDALNAQLCTIFLTERNTEVRLKAAASIEDAACFVLYTLVKKSQVERFLDTESDERLLQEGIRLIHAGAVIDKAKYEAVGVEFLLRLLRKNLTNIKPSGIVQVNAITAISVITNEDKLEQVMQTLDHVQDIPSYVISALKFLEAKSSKQLLQVLVEQKFTATSRDTLFALADGQSYEQLIETWKRVIFLSKSGLAQRVLIMLLQQKNILMVTDPSNPVVEWLNNTSSWSAADQIILGTAIRENPRLEYTLEKVVNEKRRLLEAVRPIETVEQKSTADSSTPVLTASTSKVAVTSTRWSVVLTTVAAIAMLAIYFVVPFDVPRNTTWVTQFWTRLLEVGYGYGGVAALVFFISALILVLIKDSDNLIAPAFGAAIVAGVIATACFVIQLFWIHPVFTLWGQIWLGLLLVVVVVVPIVVFVLSLRWSRKDK